jgi:hypothetical protein
MLSQTSFAALIALRDQLEQQLSASFAERHEAQLIDYQQVVADHWLLKPQQSALIACCGGYKADRQAFWAGGQAKTEGNVGMPVPYGSRVSCRRHTAGMMTFSRCSIC